MLGRRRELARRSEPLRRDSDRAGVDVAGPHHQAALGEQECGAEAVLVGAEESRDDDVAAGLEAAVDTHAHAAAQAVGNERLLGLGEAELPRASPRS